MRSTIAPLLSMRGRLHNALSRQIPSSLAYFSKRGRDARLVAVKLVDALRADPRATIIHQTPELFFAGVDLYRRRLDKGYSLTDCMSMALCREQGIADVLTHDRHFEQEGFTVLL